MLIRTEPNKNGATIIFKYRPPHRWSFLSWMHLDVASLQELPVRVGEKNREVWKVIRGIRVGAYWTCRYLQILSQWSCLESMHKHQATCLNIWRLEARPLSLPQKLILEIQCICKHHFYFACLLQKHLVKIIRVLRKCSVWFWKRQESRSCKETLSSELVFPQKR